MSEAPSHLDHLSDAEIEELHAAGHLSDDDVWCIAAKRMSPQDWALIDGIGYGVAKLLNTPINQLAAEAAAHRALTEGGPIDGPVVGSIAGAWANQATDYALNVPARFVGVTYEKTNDPFYSRWFVAPFQTRAELDDWYHRFVVTPERYHYIAAYDKTTPEWDRGSAIAAMATDGAPRVGVHLAPEAYRPAAMHAVTRRAQPNDARTWLYVALETGNAVTRPLDDYAGAMNALGAYISSAAAGTMPELSYWAVLVLGPSGPEILHDAALSSSASVGAAPAVREQLRHLDYLIGQHEVFWAQIAQENPTPQLREFLHRRWDPYLAEWSSYRPYLDTDQGVAALKSWIARHGRPVPEDLSAHFVHRGAVELSQLREFAAYNGIPTPDLGTSQHGFNFTGAPHLSGLLEDPEV